MRGPHALIVYASEPGDTVRPAEVFRARFQIVARLSTYCGSLAYHNYMESSPTDTLPGYKYAGSTGTPCHLTSATDVVDSAVGTDGKA